MFDASVQLSIHHGNMCGIFCCVHNKTGQDLQQDYELCCGNNERRGPDDLSPEYVSSDLAGKWSGDFRGWVLWTQGSSMSRQPCRESPGSTLLWNGDIFSGPLAQESASDTQHLYSNLQTTKHIVQTLGSVEGPYSFTYYDQTSQLLYFGRDPIGRHSLLMKITRDKTAIVISSVASKHLDDYIEVPAIGVFMMDLKQDHVNLTLFPWRKISDVSSGLKKLGMDIEIRDSLFPMAVKGESEPLISDFSYLNLLSGENADMEELLKVPDISTRVSEILNRLRDSVKLRVEKKPNFCKNCIRLKVAGENVHCTHSKIGLLFSGGLDSTILAAIAHEFIAKDESIDLINVAFEKAKRIENSAMDKKNKKNANAEVDERQKFEVPDRKTGKQAWEELKRLFPGRRWDFIESNVTQAELDECRRERICHVIYPLKTILDESLGCALWFAARGSGVLSDTQEPYDSPARILLLGMGADELFGGYTRHRTILRRQGWTGLTDELNSELARISERNLGRDDRVVSDHGKQSRLPYLDDNFVRYVTSLKPWERCCPVEGMPPGFGDKLLLRLCAWSLGLKKTSTFPKRAFQFGSRIAKSHENGSDISKWLS